MSWVKLDDGFPGHPKVDALLQDDERNGLAAIGLFVLSLCRAGHQLTDGDLTERAVRTLAPLNADELIEKLLEVGLLERRENGWYIHDYLDWNPSRETVLARRQAETDRKAAARAKAAEARAARDAKTARDDVSRRDNPRDTRRDDRPESARPSALPDPSRPDPSDKDGEEETRASDVCPSGFVMDPPGSAVHPLLDEVVAIFNVAGIPVDDVGMIDGALRVTASDPDQIAMAHLAATWIRSGEMTVKDPARVLVFAANNRAKKAAQLEGIRAAAEKSGIAERPRLAAVPSEPKVSEATLMRLEMEAAKRAAREAS